MSKIGRSMSIVTETEQIAYPRSLFGPGPFRPGLDRRAKPFVVFGRACRLSEAAESGTTTQDASVL
jgi:hypothetical protein